MNPFKSVSVALLVALGLASTASLAAEPVTRVIGEPLRGAKADAVVSFRAGASDAPRMTMRDLDLRKIAELQQRNQRPHVPVQIGIERTLAEVATPQPALRWTKVQGGAVSRLQVASPDALGLRVGLKFTALPDGAELRVAGSLAPDRVHLATAEQVRWQQQTARTYWSPVTDGDVQVIELFVPAGARTSAVKLQVVAVSHLLTNSIERFSLAKAIGDSGACNVDTVCRVATLGQNYVNTKNSVARMVFTNGGSTYTCTGTLLADTVTATQVPYFYTADHCIGSQTVASTLNTYWGFEATTCGGSTPAANVLRAGGADYLFSDDGDTGTDAALLRLRDIPPAGAYFNGWNANPLANVNVLAIHHPSGDLKKSSLGTKVGQDATLHEVGWTSGTTEGGSSGSGLFTGTGAGGAYELRGGLYGGFASCNNTGNINDTENRDFYSRLDQIYTDIQPYLAPAVSTGPGPTRDYTGAWYVPSESGWGFTAFQYDNEDQVLFVLFFIYDANGTAKWYELGGGWTANDVRSGQVMQSNANQPWSTSFNPALRTFTPVGTATLTFTSATTANLSFTVNGVTRNVAVSKL